MELNQLRFNQIIYRHRIPFMYNLHRINLTLSNNYFVLKLNTLGVKISNFEKI